MPIGIMGSKSLRFGSRWFSNKERERTNTCLGCFLPPRWNTLRFTQATVKTAITHNNFRDCRVSFLPFVRQPFSKQLYSVSSPTTAGLAGKVELNSTWQASRWSMPGTDYVWFGDKCSYALKVSQAMPAAISQLCWRHMRMKLKFSSKNSKMLSCNRIFNN